MSHQGGTSALSTPTAATSTAATSTAATSTAATSTAATSTAATLSVDWTRCDGHGLCAALLPGSIALDDWGYPLLDQRALAAERAGDVRRAVAVCPALALRLGA